MNNADALMQEQLMPFYKRVLSAFKENHKTLFSAISSLMAGRTNRLGIRITDNEQNIGDYTLCLEGADISHLEAGTLSSEIHTPFGIIRPYIILEKRTVEEIIKDEEGFIRNPFTTKMKYFHEMTIKFLRS